jgi:hypothetical protein
LHGDVSRERGAPRAVDDGTSDDLQVVHELTFTL